MEREGPGKGQPHARQPTEGNSHGGLHRSGDEALVSQRDWDDYSIGRAVTLEHLGALDVVFAGIIEAHRRAIEATEDLDHVTQDMLIGQSAQLEQFHWFIRAHLETSDGTLTTGAASTEKGAAKRARKR